MASTRSRDLISGLISIACPGGFRNDWSGRAYRTFGIGDEGVSFVGLATRKLQESIKKLYDTEPKISQAISSKQLEVNVVSFIAPFVNAKSLPSDSDLERFLDRLRSMPIHEYTVLRELRGVRVSQDSPPKQYGQFTVYHYASHRHHLDSLHPVDPSLFWIGDAPSELVGVPIRAASSERALELADIEFSKFQAVLTFLVGVHGERFEIGVTKYSGRRLDRAFALSLTGASSNSHAARGSNELVPMDGYFDDSTAGFDQVWGIVQKTNPTELERRLLLGIEWIGQSLADQDLANSFLKAAIALEALLTYSESAIVNSSILNQISEAVALLVESGADRRIQLERHMKDLYAKRSAVVHAGKSRLEPGDLHSLQQIGRTLILKILTTSELRGAKCAAELHSVLKRRKFESAAF